MARSQKRKNQDNNAQMSRRALVLGGLMSTTCLVLAGRMRYLQLERADDFRLLAEENRINLRLLPPARGVIYDRHGTVLADNSPNYRITMVREDAGDVDLVLSRLSRIVNIDRAKLDRARDEMMSRPPFVPVTIGIPREIYPGERRVAVTPHNAHRLQQLVRHIRPRALGQPEQCTLAGPVDVRIK